MEIINQIKKLAFSTQVAVYSFLIGTVLFLLHFVTENAYLYFTGYMYLILATFFNFIIVLWLLFNLIIHPNQRQELLIKILILLANIPIALFYFYIIFGQIPF
jgi:hypothetical protein